MNLVNNFSSLFSLLATGTGTNIILMFFNSNKVSVDVAYFKRLRYLFIIKLLTQKKIFWTAPLRPVPLVPVTKRAFLMGLINGRNVFFLNLFFNYLLTRVL